MNRRKFFKALTGLLAIPFLGFSKKPIGKKVAGKPKWCPPQKRNQDYQVNDIIYNGKQYGYIFKKVTVYGLTFYTINFLTKNNYLSEDDYLLRTDVPVDVTYSYLITNKFVSIGSAFTETTRIYKHG